MIDQFTLHRGITNGNPYLEVEIEGERYGRRHSGCCQSGDLCDASRLLTGTDFEQGDGIFTTGIYIDHYGGASFIDTISFLCNHNIRRFQFEPFLLADPFDVIRDRILERIVAVRAWVESVEPKHMPDAEESVEVVVPAGDA